MASASAAASAAVALTQAPTVAYAQGDEQAHPASFTVPPELIFLVSGLFLLKLTKRGSGSKRSHAGAEGPGEPRPRRRLTVKTVDRIALETRTSLRYHEIVDAFVAPRGTSEAEITGKLFTIGYRPIGYDGDSPVLLFRGGSGKIAVYGSERLIDFVEYVEEHGLDPANYDLRRTHTFGHTLRRLRDMIGRDARVLYPGSSNDRRVERVFPNTTHVDVSSLFGRIRGKTIIGSVTELSQYFRDGSFDAVVLSNMELAPYEGPAMYREIGAVLAPGGIILDSARGGWRDLFSSPMTHIEQLVDVYAIHRIDAAYRAAGFTPVEVPGTGARQRFYRNPE